MALTDPKYITKEMERYSVNILYGVKLMSWGDWNLEPHPPVDRERNRILFNIGRALAGGTMGDVRAVLDAERQAKLNQRKAEEEREMLYGGPAGGSMADATPVKPKKPEPEVHPWDVRRDIDI